MGFLTTITIRNDSYSELEKNKEKLADEILNAIREGKKTELMGGSIIVQEPRHVDNWGIYVHAGNTMTQVSPWDNELPESIEPGFTRGIVDFVYEQGKALKLKFESLFNIF